MATITGKMMIRDVIGKYPQTRPIFERNGMLECGGPRGPREPIVFFARVHGVDPDRLLEELNALVEGRAQSA